jgi:hypothetical protein
MLRDERKVSLQNTKAGTTKVVEDEQRMGKHCIASKAYTH